MLAINKEGQVFQVSFSSNLGVTKMKNLKLLKTQTNRKGWPNETLFVAEGEADYLVCNDTMTTPFGLVIEGVLHAAHYSEREYRALEKA